MRTARRRLSILALVACLLGSLVLGGVHAWAEGEGENSLTLALPAENDSNGDLVKDLATVSEIKADVYRVGVATKDPSYDTYNYMLTDAFKKKDTTGKMQQALESYNWEDLTALAADVVKGGGVTSLGEIGLDTGKSDLVDGLYLVVPRKALSANYEYDFNPSLVSLPTKKDVNQDGVQMTSVEDGDWLRNASVSLKPEQHPRYGSLVINKTVEDFSGEPASFVFKVTVTTLDKKTYTTYASVYYSSAGEKQATIDHIPAGSTVTVREEQMEGDPYVLVTANDRQAKITADTSDAQVSFTNKRSGTATVASGIENRFTYDESAANGTGDWVISNPNGEPGAYEKQ